jgi:hypothetical protein
MGREDSGDAVLRLVFFNHRLILEIAGKPTPGKGKAGETPKNSAKWRKTFKIHGSRIFRPPINSNNTIITFRGDTAHELNNNINAFVEAGLEFAIGNVESILLGTSASPAPSNPVAVVQAAFPGAQVISETPAPQAPAAPAQGGAPACRHGQMSYVDGAKFGKTWKAWMCPQPKEAVDKCAPQWIK